MREKLSLRITDRDGTTRECGEFVQSASWAGSVKACARTLELGLMSEGLGFSCELGSRVRFAADGEELLDGFLFGRDRDLESKILDLSCADRGLYLKRNRAAYKFRGLTPEAVTRRICTDFGIRTGELAETGAPISRNFPGASLYAMIATAYSLAAEQTGERYAVRFRGEALEVAAKKRGPKTLVLKPGSNLRNGAVSESVENLVNRVAVYDDNGALLTVHDREEDIRLYGLMQAYLKRSKGKDSAREAQRLLDDSGPEQKITVTVNGNHSLISGDCVVLKEPVTGLYGLFWIDGDAHVWTKDGDYTTKLTLNFRNIMDEQEAGSASVGA